MEINLNGVYKKSIKGLDELKMRAGGLDASARAALILINGSDSLAALQRKLGRDMAPAMQALLALGLIEPIATLPPNRPAAHVAGSGAPPASPMAVEAAPPASENSQSLAGHNAQPARWSALRREAIVRLGPYFGPDVMTVLEPLMKATTNASFLTAINALETKIALYQGKKSAARLMDGLRP